jgi:hypothetical protein
MLTFLSPIKESKKKKILDNHNAVMFSQLLWCKSLTFYSWKCKISEKVMSEESNVEQIFIILESLELAHVFKLSQRFILHNDADFLACIYVPVNSQIIQTFGTPNCYSD